MRRAERAHRRRTREKRRALAAEERAHARARRKAERELRAAESLDEEGRRRAQGALADAQARRELGRYDGLALYDCELDTPAGRVELSARTRAAVDSAANLAAAKRAMLTRLPAEGETGSQLISELERHPGRHYLLVEGSGLASLVRCKSSDERAREFASQVNVAALNAEAHARRRREAIAAAEAELDRIERRRSAAVEQAKARLEEVAAETGAIEAARQALAEADADTGELERCRAELRQLEAAPAAAGREGP